MRLNDPLVTDFEYEGAMYSVDLSFDNVLDVFDVLADESLREYERAEICLSLLLEEPCGKEMIFSLWNHIYEAFIHTKEKQSIEFDRKGNPLPVQKEQKQVLDFEKDADYIFASFRQAYNMNLYKEQGKLHWHEFKALLNGLPSDTVMQRIIQIRLWEPSKGDTEEMKQAIRDLQRTYALEEEVEE
ncbi:Gp15 family bacteriophage protein [Planococcus beigongshangi]|uniref:Gp15 family bacteriophage protein n=1 Tax=Planococcus beigongshangi TaxID=2782536 RepID=UPI00193C4DE0|nr:Gp15 family bacteriophage protein [Planococcus beigongshangi]